jgi:AraC-like DNA-binding protein
MWSRLHREPGLRVSDLGTELGWSRRHLTAAFTKEYGIGPRQAARLVRFQRARAPLGRGTPLAAAAATSGFADPAHLTRKWRDLAGCTPTAWLGSEAPLLQDRFTDG